VITKRDRSGQPEINETSVSEAETGAPENTRIPQTLGEQGDDGEPTMELSQESYLPPDTEQYEDISSSDDSYPRESSPLGERINIIDFIKISLAGVALIAGIVALILRRSS
jgi:hypothetical protein